MDISITSAKDIAAKKYLQTIQLRRRVLDREVDRQCW